MDAYHSYIGSRLSQKYSPTAEEEEEHLSDGFSMLTIDTRHSKSRRQKTKMPLRAIFSRHEIQSAFKQDMSASIADSTSSKTSSKVSTACSAASEQENLPNKKIRFKDKLARAIFQKKHTCCRCRRRRRNCAPNKTFNGIEKHYTCSKCREASNAVKNLFDKKSDSNHYEQLMSSSVHVLGSRNKEATSKSPSPHHKDSGYETATSCSTATSVYSTFTTSANTNPSIQKDNSAVMCALRDDADVNSTRSANVFKMNEPSTKFQRDLQNVSVPCSSPNLPTGVFSKTTELSNIVAGGQGSSMGVLRQIARRHVENYDGYLPEVHHHNKYDQKDTCQILADTTNLAGTSEKATSHLGSRMIKLNRSERDTLPVQNACFTCNTTCKTFFRLPWEGGWICEDCLDSLH